MIGLIKNIKEKAKKNLNFREVLETGNETQIVIMNISVGSEIGMEVHEDSDQVLYLVDGRGEAILNDEKQAFEKGDIVLVRAGTRHNFINTGNGDLKIITTYSPPHHPAGTIHKTKEKAEKAGY